MRSRLYYETIPEAAAYNAVAGFPTVDFGNAILRLKPWEERSRKQQDIARELNAKFAQLPGVIGFAVNPPSLGQSPRTLPVEYVIMAQIPYADLDRIVQQFIAEISKTGIVQNPQSDLRLNTPELRVDVNRDKLGDLGISVETVGLTLQTMLGGRQVTRFKKDGEQYDVIVQVAPRDRSRPNDISDIYVRGRDGAMVQLANVVNVLEGVSPQSLNHFQRLRAVTITAQIAPGYALGDALKMMDETAKRVLPTGAVDRPQRRVARVPRLAGLDLPDVRARAGLHLSRAGGAVRELRRPVRDHAVGAAVDGGRAVRAVGDAEGPGTSTARSAW